VKPIKEMSQVELAAYIQSSLRPSGIDVVLSGGSAVSFYSSDQYVSKDLDLINVHFAKRREIRLAMERIGFHEKGRYFRHPEAAFLVEFPEGPLSVGEEPVKEIREFELETGTLRVLSPTDCVKDRLCAYYFWNDQQGLAQAVLVAESQPVDLKEIKRWSKAQNKTRAFDVFKDKLTGGQ
jgi:hypothetical protein